MKNLIKVERLALIFGACLLASSCKQVSDETSSALKNDAGNKEVDNKPTEQFNLAEYIAKKGIGGANFKNNIKGTQYIFFNSNEEEKVDTANKAEAAKSKNKTALYKPEFELRMNGTVTSDSKKAELKTIFWIDGSLNGNKVYAGGNAIEASMVGSAKKQITIKGGLKAFGKDLISQQVNLTKPFKVTKTIDLEVKKTVLGVPKLAGIEVGVSFVANATIAGETDYLDTQSVTMSMVPSVKVTAGLQGAVKVLAFASATAKGTVTVVDGKMPSSATLGGRAASGADYIYGNVAFQPTSFSALSGEIVIGAKLSTKGAPLPKTVEAAIWSPAKTAMATLKQKLDISWEWIYKVWDSPPLIKVKLGSGYSSSFFLASNAKAACAAPALAKLVPGVQKETAKDTADFKAVGNTVLASVKLIQTKAKAAKGTCSAGGAAKTPAKTPAKK
ncbi:MAG: hypothetical protein V4655_08485 [Bdellovibrionota bacterium]